jgi:hypothetical protein
MRPFSTSASSTIPVDLELAPPAQPRRGIRGARRGSHGEVRVERSSPEELAPPTMEGLRRARQRSPCRRRRPVASPPPARARIRRRLPSSSPSSHPPTAPRRALRCTGSTPTPPRGHLYGRRRFASRRESDAHLHDGSPPSQNGRLVWVSCWTAFWRCKTTVPTQNEFGSPFASFVGDS